MSASTSFSKVAGGNIAPSIFVKLDTSNDGYVLAAGAGAQIYGVSQEGTRRAPWSELDDGNAAISGETLRVYGPGSRCYLTLGGTVSPGDRLKADASGFGVATTTDTDEYGAIAQQAGVSGNLIEVLIVPPSTIAG